MIKKFIKLTETIGLNALKNLLISLLPEQLIVNHRAQQQKIEQVN